MYCRTTQGLYCNLYEEWYNVHHLAHILQHHKALHEEASWCWMPWHYLDVSAGTVNIRDVVICKALNVGTIAVHGIKLVIVIRVGKIYLSAAFTKASSV